MNLTRCACNLCYKEKSQKRLTQLERGWAVAVHRMFYYVAVLGKIARKTNQSLKFLLMLLQPVGDTSLGLLTNHMKNRLIALFMKCDSYV